MESRQLPEVLIYKSRFLIVPFVLVMSCLIMFFLINPAEKQTIQKPSADNEFKGLEERVEEMEYHVTSRNNLVQSPNRVQNLRAFYKPGNVTIQNRVDVLKAFKFNLSTVGIFADNKLIYRPDHQAKEKVNLNRVSFDYAGYSEEFVNDKNGLRQNFIIKSAPDGSENLQVRLDVRGMEVSDAGEGKLYLTGDKPAIGPAPKLTYSDLKCWDSAGRILKSVLTHIGSKIILNVDVAGAVFPVTVDPIVQNGNPANANSKLDGEQSNSGFGCSVQSAGDVNGDGYSDVIVGAMRYDNGSADEGAAFLYYGSPTGLNVKKTKLSASQVGAIFGNAVASAGDVNADGFSDVIVASAGYTNGQNGEGAVYLYYGSAAGLNEVAHQIIESNRPTARFGQSVAFAGDINDDGFSDIVVGAPGYQNGQAMEGAAFVYKGSAAGLDVASPIIVEIDRANSEGGAAVASAGDVNGDGYNDIIVGAPGYNNGQPNEGVALVYLGTAVGLKMVPIAILEGNQTGARMGAALSSIGDSNGDGFSDIAVGAPFYDNGEIDEGAVFIYRGEQAGGINPVSVQMLEGGTAGVHVGSAISPAGDVNGDGYGDILIGAAQYSLGEANEGAAFICLGSSNGLDNGSSIFQSDQENAELGYAVASAGDVNGDGYSDIVLGMQQYDNAPNTNDGSVLVFHGSASGISQQFTTALVDAPLEAEFGFSVSSAGDVNADGFSDIIVGAPSFDNGIGKEGAAFIFHGTVNGLEKTQATTLKIFQAGSRFGASVAGIGDVNGDGISDVAVGVPNYHNGQINEGIVFIYHGSVNGIDPVYKTKIEGNVTGAMFGWAVSGAGDVDADGFRDIIVGAPGYKTGQGAGVGAVYVFKGSTIGISPFPIATIEGNQENAQFAYTVASSGDVNGDGYNDIIVGAPTHNDGEQLEGAAFIYYGQEKGILTATFDKIQINNSGAFFGYSVSSAGDVNGDGFSDVIVGAPNFNLLGQVNGAAYIFNGSASGLQIANPTNLSGTQTDAHFGCSVSGAGDVNGDGYSDVVIGASGHDNGEADEGAVFVYHGSGGGINTAENTMAEVNYPGSKLGGAVSGAGDINGDGFSDIVIGATKFYKEFVGTGNVERGAVFIYQGNLGGSAIRNNLRVYNSDLVTPLGSSQLIQDDFGAGLVARSFTGRNDGKMVWEVRKQGEAFSGNGNLASSTAFSGQQALFSDLHTMGLQFTEMSAKAGFDTKVRTRVKYSPTKAITGQVYGPWRYLPMYTQSSYTIIGDRDVLPVTLVAFDAKIVENDVELKWETASEENSDRFDIERSTNGKNWELIGSVKSNENSNESRPYHFIDSKLLPGTDLYYYRLRMVDLDNTFAYSKIATVKFDGSKAKMFTYPNPAKDFIYINATKTVKQVDIFNSLGVKVLSLSDEAGITKVDLTGLQSGIYIMKAGGKSTTIVKGTQQN